jgi:hypothetical protein
MVEMKLFMLDFIKAKLAERVESKKWLFAPVI